MSDAAYPKLLCWNSVLLAKKVPRVPVVILLPSPHSGSVVNSSLFFLKNKCSQHVFLSTTGICIQGCNEHL